MTSATESKNRGRIPGYDLARGVAVLVMVVLNFRGVLGGSQAHPLWLDLATAFLDRRAAAVLVMISGAGMTFYARAAWDAGRQRALMRRGLFLMMAGFLLILIWSGDILHVYGVLICMGALLARRPNRCLVGTGLFFFAGGAIRWLPVFDLIEEGSRFWLWDGVTDLLFTGYFPLFPWAGIFISGMLLGRIDIRKNRRGLGGGGICLFVLAAGVSSLAGADWAGMDLSLPTLPAVASGMGTGLVLILISDWAAARSTAASAVSSAVAPIAAVGRTSLTFYVLHILVLVVLSPWAGRAGLPDLLLVAGGAVAFYCLYAWVAVLWLNRMGRGPMEQAMRQFPFIRTPARRPKLPSPVRP